MTLKFGNYRRVQGNKIVNCLTGEIKECQIHEFQDEKEIFKKLKYAHYFITENWWGLNSELLILLNYDTVPITPQQMNKDFESFLKKLERKLGQKLKYVNVLLYSTDKIPRYELWISSMNNEEIVINQRTLQSIWTHGDITMTEITKENIQQLSDYYIPKNHNCRLDVYPAYTRVFRNSRKGLTKIKPQVTTYEEAQKLVKDDYKMVFGSTKSLVENIGGREHEFQRYNFETYIKEEYQVPPTTDGTEQVANETNNL